MNELQSTDAEALVRFGASLLAANDAAGAADAAFVALAADEKSLPAWQLRGAALAALAQWEEAAAAYRQLTILSPQHVAAWVDLAEAELARLNFAAAATALKAAIALDQEPRTPAGLRAQFLVAQTLEKLGVG